VHSALGHGEKRRRAGRGAVENGGALPLYRGRGGGWWPVIKAEEWLALIGMKRLTLNWHFTPWVEGGGRGNGRGMR
jgi:hypothetical protein